ncbi:MAG: hypothetical protein H0X19_14695 [Rubrobacter sp.]|nr:hypothetical protein [Rubrobacteraceae bacterium]MBA3795365.1 hypothetical protein [Rubrobacter sp.]MDQ3315751.1 hypothetical protein [Actinomycetota bacterium]
MHGMGDDPRLWKLHREEVGREIRAQRRPGRSGETQNEPGRLAAFWRELGLDAARLVGVFGPSVKARKRKGVT